MIKWFNKQLDLIGWLGMFAIGICVGFGLGDLLTGIDYLIHGKVLEAVILLCFSVGFACAILFFYRKGVERQRIIKEDQYFRRTIELMEARLNEIGLGLDNDILLDVYSTLDKRYDENGNPKIK